ncbi:MAG: galactose mutarotase [Paracoccaceae bacterium]|nr:MAG: galactose mutarotase [Paracoccaceae bacterium]
MQAAEHFGTAADGQAVRALTLAAGGLTVRVLTLGAILNSVRLAGVPHDLTLGSARLADYAGPMRFHGAIVGPVANRISGSSAVIDGVTHPLGDAGDPAPLLHSGRRGLHARVWDVADHDTDRATLSLDLAAGDAGFPGRRRISATFSVAAPATLRLTLTAGTDAPTPMNLASHSYWNLDGSPGWAGHRLRIAADRILAHHADGRVTGPVLPVGGTPHDLRRGRLMHPQAPDFDHNYCLADARRDLTEVLEFTGRSGIAMRMATTEPGLQVYDGRGATQGLHGPWAGMAFEPQFWPDAPANAGFPSIILRPGEPWEQVTEWRFAG